MAVRVSLSLFSVLAFAAMLMPEARGQYPNKPVHIVVPFPAGGGLDAVMRIIQPRLAEQLGKAIIIENKGGAAGIIGTTHASRAAPDGYTLLAVFDSHVINPHLYKEAPDIDAFDAVTMMVSLPLVLVANASFPANTVGQILALAKAKAGRLTYGSTGPGAPQHLGVLLLSLSHRERIDMIHVPFKGGAPLVQAMLSNEVDFTFTFPSGVLPHISAGKLKAIAVGGRQRMAQLPDVPTVAETIPGFELMSWLGIVAPKGVPAAVSDRIQRAVRQALTASEAQQRLTVMGYMVNASTPEEFSAFMKTESERLGKVIRDFGVKVE
ncbi:MAG: tripartite tricarboxylate transporter substrate binding protein [Burkholderiales bacterium]|nr:tripartite tricarboxylate transporter substrate binding protein [Burkholderiales bacterium]